MAQSAGGESVAGNRNRFGEQDGSERSVFIYDIIKIFILLSVLIFSISYIQSFFPPERTKKILGRFHGIGANTLAALLGTVTPFCSCSSIPLFIGFTSAGLPLGVTFSFLISSPLVDLGSLVMLTGSFGSKVALAYVLVGLVLAVLGGTLIERLHLENDVEEFIRNAGRVDLESPQMSVRDRLSYAKTQVASTVRKVAPYVLVGVAIGALIHNFIPQAFVEELLGAEHWYSVPLATLIGIPMYADIFGTIPIAESLFAKGAGLGTVLSFMMGVTALSLPSMVMLRKAVKPRLLAVFLRCGGGGNHADWIFALTPFPLLFRAEQKNLRLSLLKKEGRRFSYFSHFCKGRSQ